MPDWNSPVLIELKDFIEQYITALNEEDFDILSTCFASKAVLHRGMKNYVGRDSIISWYKAQLPPGNLKFELVDASAGILPDSSAKCILWFEIIVKHNDKFKRDIHIEAIDLEKHCGHWVIKTCFGLGYDPEYHKKYFGKFTQNFRD